MPTTSKALPLNHHRSSAVFFLIAASAFYLCFFSLSFAHASEPSNELIDPKYFAAFTPQLMDRIRKDADEVSVAYKIAPQDAMIACSNFWILKCKALEEQGEICQNDRNKTEAEFQAWREHVTDLFKGISCLQSLRWERDNIRKHPGRYILVD